MKELTALASRNLKIYLRDKSAVFFSLLSTIIVITLMLVFLGDMNVNTITRNLSEMNIGSPEQNKKNAELFIFMWTIGGILCVNSVTIPLMITSIMINDFTGGQLQSFRTTPVSRIKLSLGYIFASWVASALICFITLIISEIIAFTNGALLPDFSEHLKLYIMILINCFTYSGIMYFAGIFIKSTGAWSGFSTLIGTLVGFLGGIYIPIGGLPEGVQTILKCFPILHGCSMFRQILTAEMGKKIFENAPEQFIQEYYKQMGIIINFGDVNISWQIQLAILMTCGIIFILIASAIVSQRYKSDR